jgi:hypothetical protein
MSATSQAFSSRAVSSGVICSESISSEPSRRARSARGETSRSKVRGYSTATDLPNFAGYHAPERRIPPTPNIPNPIGEIISDELFEQLKRYDLINIKGLRDFTIKHTYQKLRDEYRCSRIEAIRYIVESYPYLQVDTVRKIVYRVNRTTGRKPMI